MIRTALVEMSRNSQLRDDQGEISEIVDMLTYLLERKENEEK
jgi:hypothetical protein